MRKAQVFLREDQKLALQRLSRRTGRKQSELIRHGVDLAIAEGELADNNDWKAGWAKAFGIWADRTDLDDAATERRGNSARRAESLARHWRRT
jgi:hypothetical protein